MAKKYIDAEHFKQRITKAALIANKPDLYEFAKAMCEMVDIEDAADVTPVVHGEWKTTILENTPSSIRTGAPHCSVCKKTAHNRTLFCPNCFAKMDGGSEKG